MGGRGKNSGQVSLDIGTLQGQMESPEAIIIRCGLITTESLSDASLTTLQRVRRILWSELAATICEEAPITSYEL